MFILKVGGEIQDDTRQDILRRDYLQSCFLSSIATQKSQALFSLLMSIVEKRIEGGESRKQTVESREERYGTRRDVLRRDFL